MPERFAEAGHKCLLCGQKFYGKGSLALAEKCEKNEMPPTRLENNTKWEIERGKFRISVLIIASHVTAVIINGVPIKHRFMYDCVIFEVFRENDTSGVWRSYFKHEVISDKEFVNAKKWSKKVVLSG